MLAAHKSGVVDSHTRPPVLPAEIITQDCYSANPSSQGTAAHSNGIQQVMHWCAVWMIAWLGTTLSGGVFGVCVGGVFAIPGLVTAGPAALLLPLYGAMVGLLWSGAVGSLITPTLAIACWICGLQRRPTVLAAVNGFLTGAIAMPLLFFVTGAVGALGGWLGTEILRGILPATAFHGENELQGTGQFNYTIRGLMLRTLAVALLITYWMAAIEVVQAWWYL